MSEEVPSKHNRIDRRIHCMNPATGYQRRFSLVDLYLKRAAWSNWNWSSNWSNCNSMQFSITVISCSLCSNNWQSDKSENDWPEKANNVVSDNFVIPLYYTWVNRELNGTCIFSPSSIVPSWGRHHRGRSSCPHWSCTPRRARNSSSLAGRQRIFSSPANKCFDNCSNLLALYHWLNLI